MTRKWPGRISLAIVVAVLGSLAVLLPIAVAFAQGVSFSPATNFLVGGQRPVSVAVGDLNGDGKLDLAVANADSNTVSILLGNGKGVFGAATDFAVRSSPHSVAIADLDGDGKLDLAVANYLGSSVSILLGNSGGGFSAATPRSAEDLPAPSFLDLAQPLLDFIQR